MNEFKNIPSDEDLKNNLEDVMKKNNNFSVDEKLHGINWFSFFEEKQKNCKSCEMCKDDPMTPTDLADLIVACHNRVLPNVHFIKKLSFLFNSIGKIEIKSRGSSKRIKVKFYEC